MTGDDEPEALVWHYGWISTNAAGPDAAAGIVVHSEVPAHELDELQAALGFAEELRAHALHDVRESAQEFVEALIPWTAPTRVGADARPLQRALSEWLFYLRAFADHTPHQLSRRFGRASDEHRAFDDAASTEYDADFNYRFAYKLRGYAQHTRRPIQNVRASASGTRDLDVATFDAEVLLREYDGWGAAVKRDLQAIGGPFSVLPVVAGATDTCDRITARVVLGLEKRIRHTREVLAAAVGRAPQDAAPYLMGREADPPTDMPPGTTFNLRLCAVPRGLPEELDMMLERARARLTMPRPPSAV